MSHNVVQFKTKRKLRLEWPIGILCGGILGFIVDTTAHALKDWPW